MNGAQDMGGMMGFGPVERLRRTSLSFMRHGSGVPSPSHWPWPPRAAGISTRAGSARESLIPAGARPAKSYYEIWIAGLERLMAERGLVASDEIDAGKSLHPPKAVPRVLMAERVPTVLASGGPTERVAAAPQRFQVGQLVRAHNVHPTGHTRLPRYVRGRVGTVTHVHGAHVLPDTNAAGRGENPQWLYTVRFAARELWGEAADPTGTVSVDAWESYLEPR